MMFKPSTCPENRNRYNVNVPYRALPARRFGARASFAADCQNN